jgi:hypothetical protein
VLPLLLLLLLLPLLPLLPLLLWLWLLLFTGSPILGRHNDPCPTHNRFRIGS